MASVAPVEAYRPQFQALMADMKGREGNVARELRRSAWQSFKRLGFPSRRQEGWRQTDVSRLAQASFARADEAAAVALSSISATLPGAHLAVVVNGRLRLDLSHLDRLPAGAVVADLEELVAAGDGTVLSHLAHLAKPGDSAFAALNTALFAGGVVVSVARRVVVEEPIQVVSVVMGNGRSVVAFPRCLILLAEGSRATVVESFVGGENDEFFDCPVTEMVIGDGANLDHYKVQLEGESGSHMASQATSLGRSAVLTSHSFALGGGLVRNDLRAVLAAEGGSAVLNGLYVVGGRQHVDNHMRVEHLAPRCESHELYKGILDGHGSAVFDGLIHVHPGAQKTNAKQSNRNLLLSREALANSNPQLRIFADDVKCTHGSTVGQLEEDAIFYLQSRGIDRRAAEGMLTWAFATEVLRQVRVPALREDLDSLVLDRLGVSDEVRGVS